MRNVTSRKPKSFFGLPAIAAVSLMAMAAPALADVKAGVDAWSAGDYAAAVREWSGPAAQGDPDAQFNMAQAYRLGRGVETNPREAEQLYKSAAAQGHIKAADNYGLLLFQDGRRSEAMPYVNSAAGRGDPRAQYLLGIAHFNGDLVRKDWVRAYALMTLANGTGLPQARNAMSEMDKYVPIEQRQQAQSLARSLKAEAEANRARSLAAADLQFGAPQQSSVPPAIASAAATAARVPSSTAPSSTVPVSTVPASTVPASVAVSPRSPSSARSAAPAAAARPVTVATQQSQPGADYTVPARSTPKPASTRPVTVAAAPSASSAIPTPRSKPITRAQTAATAAARPASMTGPWKVQLGAFGVAGNADRLWSRLASHSALAGAAKVKTPAGRLTRLLAGGFPSRSAANKACAQLKRSGQDCLVTR